MNKGKSSTLLILLIVLLAVLSMASCQKGSSDKTYADGKYTGRSLDHNDDESGNGAGYGIVELEIKDGALVSCEFRLYKLDGTLKDETYGSDLSQANRLKAQKAVQSAAKYAQALVSAGTGSKVEVISGATISHSEFTEAVNDALSKAAR